ncbi:unnamed protein product [Closterium sp. Naga37s-1]|nr:unnamed protein product [Closterium sp. Naga37s-1]
MGRQLPGRDGRAAALALPLHHFNHFHPTSPPFTLTPSQLCLASALRDVLRKLWDANFLAKMGEHASRDVLRKLWDANFLAEMGEQWLFVTPADAVKLCRSVAVAAPAVKEQDELLASVQLSSPALPPLLACQLVAASAQPDASALTSAPAPAPQRALASAQPAAARTLVRSQPLARTSSKLPARASSALPAACHQPTASARQLRASHSPAVACQRRATCGHPLPC